MRAAALAVMPLLAAGLLAAAHAHTTVEVPPYEIEVGWGTEPPIVGIRNDLVFRVIERGGAEGAFTGVTGVFGGVEATAVFGGATKVIGINSDPRPGYYYSPIIPTRTGGYSVDLAGEIRGVPVDVSIPIEDVEPTSLLDFPQVAGSGSEDVAALKNAVSSLQRDIAGLGPGGAPAGGASYDIAILGLSMAGAAIVLSVVGMTRKR